MTRYLLRQKAADKVGMKTMLELIKKNYDFSDYQIAQLRFFFLSMFSEISKMLLISLFFIDKLPLYIWTIIIFQVFRSSCGGLHCKTYWGCFFVSLGYMLLSIRILPLIPTDKLFQIVSLFLCIIVSYRIGPLTSVLHPVLTDEVNAHLKNRVFFLIFIYLTILYIVPQNPYLTVGYWVIILNTLQLVAAKIQKKEEFLK